MLFLGPVFFLWPTLLAVGGQQSLTTTTTTTTWFIDGNNLKGQRAVPSDRETIVEKLKPMTEQITPKNKSYHTTNVVLVFDGRRGESASVHTHPMTNTGSTFQTIVAGLPQSADDYIVETIEKNDFVPGRAHVVTADRVLKMRVLQTKNLNGGAVVDPAKFWTYYLPNLTGNQQ
jgi:predicted RNA-binding protein with PIN domain